METKLDRSFLWLVLTVIGILVLTIINAAGFPIFMWLAWVITLGVVLGIAWIAPKLRWPIVIITVVLAIWQGADELAARFQLPEPRVTIDNSVDLYPMPSESSPEFPAWLHEKEAIDKGEGAQKVLKVAWLASAGAFWGFFVLAWLFARIPVLRRVKIPINIVFLLVWIGISLWAVSSPIDTREMDEATSSALNLQWWIGFTKNIWWPAAITAISWGIKTMKSGAGASGIYMLGLIATSFTWLALQLVQVTFDPTTISWTLCSNQVLETSMTMSLCQEAFVSGKVAALAVSMVWAWLLSLIDL